MSREPLRIFGESGLLLMQRKPLFEGTMSSEKDSVARTARVIVIGNEKGGSGKSTVAMHVCVALMKSGYRVATIDLDSRQKSLNNYTENGRNGATRVGRGLKLPTHFCIEPASDSDEATACTALADTVEG